MAVSIDQRDCAIFTLTIECCLAIPAKADQTSTPTPPQCQPTRPCISGAQNKSDSIEQASRRMLSQRHHSTRRSKNSHIRIETSQSSQWDHTLQGPIFTPPRQQPNINQLTKYVNFVATTTPHWTNNGKQTFLSQAFHSRQLSLRRSKNLDQKTSNTTKKYREDLRCGSLSTIPSEWLKS